VPEESEQGPSRPTLPGAAWYPDPEVAGQLRYWDGNRWTEHRHVRAAQPDAQGTSQAAVASKEEPEAAALEPQPVSSAGPTPPSRGSGMLQSSRGWGREHPVTALGVAAAVGLAVGLSIGIPSGVGIKQSDADEADQQLADARNALTARRRANRLLQLQKSNAEAKVARLSARGTVPDLTGATADEAEAQGEDFKWKFKVLRQPSARAPGTVIAQQPAEGTVLSAGRSVTLTVAIPRPKEWRTIKSFSGAGAQSTDEFTLPSGRLRLNYSFSGEGNDIIYLVPEGTSNQFEGDLLFNEIGTKSGSTRLYDDGRFYLHVDGDSWNIEVQQFK
jgi:PASTA domain-containing protein/uncharacterized protein DUF2510